MAVLGRQIADPMRSIDVEDPEQAFGAFFRALTKKFPYATWEDIVCAQRITEDEYRTEQEEQEADVAELGRLITFPRKHRVPEDTPFREAVTLVAATGDLEAIAFHNALNAPERAVWLAVFNAAVDRHPDRGRDGAERYACLDEDSPQGTPESLVDWVQINFPHEAREIEGRIINESLSSEERAP